MKDYQHQKKTKKPRNPFRRQLISAIVRIKKTRAYRLLSPSARGVRGLTLGLHNKIHIIHFLLFFVILMGILITTIGYMISSITSIEFQGYASTPSTIKEYPMVEINHPIDISAKAFIVYEKDSRVVVRGRAENLRFSPASTIKIMSALVAMEHYRLDTVLTVQNLQVGDGSVMKLYNGERITVENLLYGLMLPSGNDAAQTLARNYPGGEVAFVKRMNEKADELAMTNSRFVDPSGYEDDNYTSAFDLARLAAAALDNKAFAEIVGTEYKIVFDTTNTYAHELINLNRLLYLDGVTGVKTGFTNEAGGVLVTSIEYKGKAFVIVVLKSEDRFADTETLIYDIVKNTVLLKY
jgi:D-alanyl-D-alanine carboxypeptidase